MAGLKKPAAVYLIGVAIAVAVFFVVNTFLVDSIDVLNVWYVLDALMFIGLVIALPYNYARKRSECDGDPAGSVTRRYLDVNAAYYAHGWRDDPLPAQLVRAAGPGAGSPGQQRFCLGDLGIRGHDAAHRLCRDRPQPLEGSRLGLPPSAGAG